LTLYAGFVILKLAMEEVLFFCTKKEDSKMSSVKK